MNGACSGMRLRRVWGMRRFACAPRVRRRMDRSLLRCEAANGSGRWVRPLSKVRRCEGRSSLRIADREEGADKGRRGCLPVFESVLAETADRACPTVRTRRRSFREAGLPAFPKERQAGEDRASASGSIPTEEEGGWLRSPSEPGDGDTRASALATPSSSEPRRRIAQAHCRVVSETGNGQTGLGLARTRREPPRPHGLDGTHGNRRRHPPPLGTRPPSG